MKTQKHTEGEWEVKGKFDDEIYITFSKGSNMEHHLVIAQTHGASDEARANAKLIAAAPDLLKALKRVIEYVRYPTIPANSGAIKEGVDAIKKATE